MLSCQANLMLCYKYASGKALEGNGKKLVIEGTICQSPSIISNLQPTFSQIDELQKQKHSMPLRVLESFRNISTKHFSTKQKVTILPHRMLISLQLGHTYIAWKLNYVALSLFYKLYGYFLWCRLYYSIFFLNCALFSFTFSSSLPYPFHVLVTCWC